MNKVFLIGRLTRDPELRYTSSNIPSARFSLAVDRPFTSQSGERETDFINIVVWRKQAENVKNYLTQGSQAAIEGRIQVRSYDDQSGQKRYITEVIADNVEFLGSRSSTNNSNNSSASSNEPTPYDYQESNSVNVENDPFAEFGDSVSIDDNFLE